MRGKHSGGRGAKDLSQAATFACWAANSEGPRTTLPEFESQLDHLLAVYRLGEKLNSVSLAFFHRPPSIDPPAQGILERIKCLD